MANTKDTPSIAPAAALTQTLAYEQSFLYLQLQSLNQAIGLCEEQEKLIQRLTDLQSRRQSVPSDLAKTIKAQEIALQKSIASSESNYQQARERLLNDQREFNNADARIESLKAGQFSETDLARLEKARTSTSQSKLSAIEQLRSELEQCNIRREAFRNDIIGLELQLENSTNELGELNNQQIPDALATLLKETKSAAYQEHETQRAQYADLIDALQNSIQSIETGLSNSDKQIHRARENAKELARLQSLSVFLRFSSPIWWESFSVDYSKQSEVASAKKNALSKTKQDLLQQLDDLQSKLQGHVSSKEAYMNQVVEVEIQRQRAIRQSHVEKIPQQINDLRLSNDQAESEFNELQRKIKNARMDIDSMFEAVTKEEQRRIVEEATNAAESAKQKFLDAERDEQESKLALEKARADLSDFEQSRNEEIQVRQREIDALLSETRERLASVMQDLEQLNTQNDLGIAPPYRFEAFINARNSRLARLTQMESNAEQPPAISTDQIDSLQLSISKAGTTWDSPLDDQNAHRAENLPRLYIDFDRNADETTLSVGHVSRQRQQRQGQFNPGWVPNSGLRDQLLALRTRIGEAFFPDWLPDTDSDILFYFRDLFFPDGFTGEFLFSNISLEEDFPVLCVRPSDLGPRAQYALPDGMSLAVCGHLYDNRTNANNPVLVVQRIVEMSISPPRKFERAHYVVTASLPDQLYPANQRQRNILDSDFVASLPPISIRTRERLRDWRAYLDWKDRLIQSNLDGLRFLSAEVLPESQVRFLTVSESKQRYEECKRLFRKDELRAFELGYSTDKWNFKYNSNHRGRGRDIELGDFVRDETLSSLPNVDLEGSNWEKTFAANVYFRLNEDDQNEFDAISQERSVEDAVAELQGRIHKQGFLALSVVGDVALINRQRREIEQLQQQSGYAPFLSSYLFDIKSANAPNVLVDIADNEWFRDDLNEDQRQAVRMMISVPDLAMVQGPPGTGKTTMIAEATYQLTRQGKKVLLASQANLAVDNALERLAQSPSIRAIRLGRKGEKDHPFSQNNALATYYAAIAKTCRSRTIDAWHGAEEEKEALSRWLSNAELVANDLAELKTKIRQLETQRTQLIAEFDDEQNILSQAYKESNERTEVKNFLKYLDGDNEWSGNLPEDVLSTFYASITLPLKQLREFGICLNSYWFGQDEGTIQERALYAVGILKAWRRLLQWLPQIEGDLTRLQAQDGEQMLSAHDAFQLKDLQHRFQEVQEELVDDGSRLEEYQDLQRKIREIKRRGAGLDKSMYEQVFNEVGDPPAYRMYTDPNASRSVCMNGLKQATNAVRSLQVEIDHGLEHVREKCINFLERPLTYVAEAGKARRLEGQLRDLASSLTDLAGQKSEKEVRLWQLSRERGENNRTMESAEDPTQFFNDIRQSIKSRLSEIEKQLLQTKGFRNAWEPILDTWVKDLTNADTNANDQHFLLPTYIAACNVVGVTCTENRRTLEEAGHTRFDVVIVDEVSKATPPELIMPLMLGRTAILVGDHRQLPPLFKEQGGSWEEVVAEQEEHSQPNGNTSKVDSASELNADNLQRFKKMVTASLFKEHFENAPESLKSFLFTQYRMHPQIMQIVNRFYDNRLECGLIDPDGKIDGTDPKGHRLHHLTLNGPNGKPYLKPDQHVLWIDSATDPFGREHRERLVGSGGKVNDLEATLIAKLLCDLEVALRVEGYGQNGKDPKQVGVVTFYGRQVRNIREAVNLTQRLFNLKFHAIRYDINTVDRYQGQERPIVIVSMVRNPPWKLSQRANTAQFERVNVAFSRAQELLVVLGAKDVFCRYPVNLPNLDRPGSRKIEVYRLIIDEIQRNGGFWTSDAILSKDDASRLMQNHNAKHNVRNKR